MTSCVYILVQGRKTRKAEMQRRKVAQTQNMVEPRMHLLEDVEPKKRDCL